MAMKETILVFKHDNSSFLSYSALAGACGYIIGMERGKDK